SDLLTLDSCTTSHTDLFFFLLLIPPPPRSTLFPYTTLFRSLPIKTGPATVRCWNDPWPDRRPITMRPASATTLIAASVFCITLPDRKSTRLNSSHRTISYAVFCLKKKKKKNTYRRP